MHSLREAGHANTDLACRDKGKYTSMGGRRSCSLRQVAQCWTDAREKQIYTRPGSNWRPSACEADVIATRPLVQVIAILRADSSLHSFVCFAPVRAPMQTRRCFVVMNAWRFCQAALPHQARKAPCGIRTHDLPLTERVLYQLS